MKRFKKIAAIICTRDKEFGPVLLELVDFYRKCGIQTIVNVGSKSIFEAYRKSFEAYADEFDAFIFCHDDIKILMNPDDFCLVLNKGLNKEKVGFVGVAGTTLLSKNAVWWDQEYWARGKHSGMVMHGDGLDCDNFRITYYGEHRPVVVMDGLFLAANTNMLRNHSLFKPESFPGEWDFYDIVYTARAHVEGFINYTIPILLIHNSFGNLAGRESWHKNREEFINSWTLPLEI